MKKQEVQLEALKKIRDKNKPDLGDYTRAISSDIVPFGDQVSGLLGGAASSAGRFVGGLQQGEDLSTALSEGASAFPEGRRESMDMVEQSRDKLPASVQGASLAAGMLMPFPGAQAAKAGKLANLADKGNDAAHAAIAAAKAKRMGKFENLANLMQKGKGNQLAKAEVISQPKWLESLAGAEKAFAEKIAPKLADLPDEHALQVIKEAGKRGMY